jgi:hypothetical protein
MTSILNLLDDARAWGLSVGNPSIHPRPTGAQGGPA